MALASFLRLLLKLANVALVVVGLSAVGYSLYMYREFHNQTFPSDGKPGSGSEHVEQPWFIYAFGGAGAWSTLTAMTGLVGAHNSSKACLSCYTMELFVMLVAQGVLAIAFFADDKLAKYIPEDATGNEEAMHAFLKRYQKIVQWFALGVLVLQVLSVVLACALKSAAGSDDGYGSDDDEWESAARSRLLRTEGGNTSSPQRERRMDPWSQRMRDKYGLDTSEFSYNPVENSSTAQMEEGQEAAEAAGRSRCSIQ